MVRKSEKDSSSEKEGEERSRVCALEEQAGETECVIVLFCSHLMRGSAPGGRKSELGKERASKVYVNTQIVLFIRLAFTSDACHRKISLYKHIFTRDPSIFILPYSHDELLSKTSSRLLSVLSSSPSLSRMNVVSRHFRTCRRRTSSTILSIFFSSCVLKIDYGIS